MLVPAYVDGGTLGASTAMLAQRPHGLAARAVSAHGTSRQGGRGLDARVRRRGHRLYRTQAQVGSGGLVALRSAT
jgi:hypothetical protein